jgi:hypothetical protein
LECEFQTVFTNGYKNWSLLQKRARPDAGVEPHVTSPAPLARVVGSPNRYYLHGDRHAEHTTKFYCRSCDEFVDADHFYDKHDSQETLKRALEAINRRTTRDPEQLERRPVGAPNMLEGPARAQAERWTPSLS